MKLPKPIKLLNLEKKEDLEKAIEEKDTYHLAFSLGDSIPWKRDTKQIFLFYVEKMASLLPQENRYRLEFEALSFFPTVEDVLEYDYFQPWHFALPFDISPVDDTTEEEKDKEEKKRCIDSKTPCRESYYGRIYTKMPNPRETSQSKGTKTIGEELIEVAERLVFSLRLDVRQKAWDISESTDGMKDALRLMDWFNEFSSSFMAEIGKIACGKNKNFINGLELSIEKLAEEINKRDGKINDLEERDRQREIQEKQKQTDRSKDLLKEEPIWIRALCGDKEGFNQVLNYKLVRKGNTDFDLEFSFCLPKYTCGKLAERIIEDDDKLPRNYYEYKLRPKEKGFETRLKLLSNRLNDGKNGDVHNRLATSISKKK